MSSGIYTGLNMEKSKSVLSDFKRIKIEIIKYFRIKTILKNKINKQWNHYNNKKRFTFRG